MEVKSLFCAKVARNSDFQVCATGVNLKAGACTGELVGSSTD